MIGLLAGFMIGFGLANTLYRRELDEGRRRMAAAEAPSAPAKSAGSPADEARLSDEEIRNVIARADANPQDSDLQQRIGQALFLYAAQTRNAAILPDIARLLKRAHDANPKDRETVMLLANALTGIGQTSDPSRLEAARGYYLKALELKADDAEARTNLGFTYYVEKPPDLQRAIAEYRKALAIDPRYEAALQHLAAALISAGQFDEAQKRIDELQRVNPSHEELPNLRALLAQSRNAAREKN